MLNPALFQSLPSVRTIIADGDTVFIIPTFQRPYAWEKKQILDLSQDLCNLVGRNHPEHYFAQAHIVDVDGPQSSLLPLLDAQNTGLTTALDAKQSGHISRLYAVVDGQQRLVTLYLLSIFQELLSPSQILQTPFPNLFRLRLPNGSFLPRIILGTGADHTFFANMVDWLLGQQPGIVTATNIRHYIDGLITNPNSPSQKRLKAAGILLLDKFFLPSVVPSVDFIAKREIRMGLTELDTQYALTSFITLNDRGKTLSVLERLKALWLDRSMTTGGSVVTNIHRVFGDLYRTADRCTDVGLAKTLDTAEDLICQLLYHWLDMQDQSHVLWYGAEKIYEWFVSQPTPANVLDWVQAADQLRAQLDYLCITYLDPNSATAPAPSIHYPATSTLYDDYFAILIRHGLHSSLLALLLKFRQQFGIEWHDRYTFPLAVNPQLFQPICNLLSVAGNNPLLAAVRKRIENKLPHNCGNTADPEPTIVNVNKSILEAVERIQVLAWTQGSNPRSGFIGQCAITFASTSIINQQIAAWYAFCNISGTYDRYYLDTLCNRNAPNSETYLLWEWERWLIEQAKGTAITSHLHPPLELEHVLPAAWKDTVAGSGQTFVQWGFKDPTDFQRSLLERIGNKALLWQNCNRSVGNDHPYIKALHYVGGSSCKHTPNASSLKQVQQLGQDLQGLGASPSPVFKEYFELRCAELAVFALQRLC